MSGNTFGKLILTGVTCASISAMSYLIYEDNKRYNKDVYIQKQNILPKIAEGSTYVSPYLRSYGSSYVKPNKVNEQVMPAMNNNYDSCDINNCVILANLDDNVYKDNNCDMAYLTNIIRNVHNYQDNKYDKYFE
tara:strand:+ start:78 stop:479 length:402 start_codon:yes stop_codon:yes gene_type:complete